MFYIGSRAFIQFTSLSSILEDLGLILLSILPQLFVSVSAIILGRLFIRIIKTNIQDQMKNQRLGEHISHTLIKLLQWVTYLFVASVVLVQFGLKFASITGFVSIMGGTVIGFAAINTLGNAIAGFIVMMSRPFKVGDRIFFNGRFSDVITINLIYTKLRTLDLVYVSVPNQELLKNELDNYGRRNIIRQSLKVTAGYDDRRSRVTRILLNTVKTVPDVLKAPLPYVSVTDFQRFAVEYTVYYFIKNVSRMARINATIMERIMDAFLKNNIDMTTPTLVKNPSETENGSELGSQVQDVSDSNVQSVDIMDIKGIGEVYGAKLNSIYIYSVRGLLEAGRSREGRTDLSEKTGIPLKFILKWVNLADLFRVEGIGSQYSELVEASGVDTVVDLARRNPRKLRRRLVNENKSGGYVKALPTLEEVEEWISNAKTLPRIITY